MAEDSPLGSFDPFSSKSPADPGHDLPSAGRTLQVHLVLPRQRQHGRLVVVGGVADARAQPLVEDGAPRAGCVGRGGRIGWRRGPWPLQSDVPFSGRCQLLLLLMMTSDGQRPRRSRWCVHAAGVAATSPCGMWSRWRMGQSGFTEESPSRSIGPSSFLQKCRKGDVARTH